MSALHPGGYHWLDHRHVRAWLQATRDVPDDIAAGYARILSLVDAVARSAPGPVTVLDLGAGDGGVSALLLEQLPSATTIQADMSPEMMQEGTQRLAAHAGRFHYVHWDMNVGDWPDPLTGPFHAIVSSLALHHLDHARRQWLVTNAVPHLLDHGALANFDLYRHPDASFSAGEEHDQNCATIDEFCTYMRAAGFRDLNVTDRSDRPKHKGCVAVVSGRRP